MRVIAGSARGRRLAVPPGRAVRPTPDRVREALFSRLAARVEGAAVLDLYAGSGALAVEALSRGAGHAVLVERDRRSADVAAANLERAGVAPRARVARIDAARFAAEPRGGPFDLVLVDPPYATPLSAVYARLADLQRAGALAPDATVVVERDKRDPDLDLPPPEFLASEAVRTYGDTVLVYFVTKGSSPR